MAVADMEPVLFDSARAKQANARATPLKVTEQRRIFAKMAQKLEIAADVMSEQVSRHADAGEKPEDLRQEQRAAAGVLAKLANGLETIREATRILHGRSLPPSLHHEPIPAKPAARAKPLNRPPPSLRPEPTPQANGH